MPKLVVLCIGFFSFSVLTGQAQIPGAAQIFAEDQPNAATNIGSDPVGPGDLVHVSVVESPELTRSYRVSPAGTISVPLLVETIRVSGFVPSEIERVVARALEQGRILVAPVVSVMVLEYRSRPVTVSGAVKHPLTLQAIGGIKLLDALARAEGLAPNTGPEIVISSLDDAAIRRVSVKELFAGENPVLNIELHGGEQIRVPEAGKLYVVGNVKSPGIYPVSELEGTTLLQALALSQGLLPYAQKQAYVYRLRADEKERQEIQVPLDRILHRTSADFMLLSNDILYIPDNSAKRLSARMLERITGVAGSTLSGLIIWGR